VELSRIFSELKTEIVVIPGDIDSSLAAAISALKCNVQIVHVESGLRSFDRKMPEEQNRIIIDELSSVLFITEFSGLRNIHPAPTQKLFYVGNTMIDSIISNNTEIERSNILIELNLQSFDYILCTFHRPSNVDDPEKLGNIFKKLSQINKNKTIIFPIHPRTLEILEKNPFLFELTKEIRVVPALNYFDFQKLLKNCFFVVTDSGGIQEEAAYYLKKCYTYRLNTERPATIFSGSNILILSDNWNEFINIYDEEIGEDLSVIDLWDGKSSYRIVEILKAIL
jgi:UDP-N-acetylglucosamine 2-epimerase (non-hydrolysing)